MIASGSEHEEGSRHHGQSDKTFTPQIGRQNLAALLC